MIGHAFFTDRTRKFFTGGIMRALNLYTLTRINDSEAFSGLENALSGRPWHKAFSSHEAASLCALVNGLADCFMAADTEGTSKEQIPAPGDDWVSFFDGFYFSYTIEHISKEFDLLKFSANADCALNIELKSEAIEEDRIRKQLEQNRYYLFHIAHRIIDYRNLNRECGIAILSIDEELLQNVCKSSVQDEKVFNFLVDGDGRIISFGGDTGRIGEVITDMTEDEQMRREDYSSYYRDHTGASPSSFGTYVIHDEKLG